MTWEQAETVFGISLASVGRILLEEKNKKHTIDNENNPVPKKERIEVSF
jgi:hypothetical protein